MDSTELSEVPVITTENRCYTITAWLLCFLFMACCLISISYNFNPFTAISSKICNCACFILICFIIYIFWNHNYGPCSGNKEQLISEQTKKLFTNKYLNATQSMGNIFDRMNQQGYPQAYPQAYQQAYPQAYPQAYTNQP